MAAKKAPKAPKYTVANIAQLMKLLATAVRSDAAPQLPKGCTHAIYHRRAKGDVMYAAWPSKVDGSLHEMEIEAYDGDVVFTDKWGVKCIKDHMRKGDQEHYVFLTLRSTPQEDTDKKRIPKTRDPLPEGQTALGLISDAILKPSQRTATGKLKPSAFFTKGIPPSGKEAMAAINDNGRLLKWEKKTAGFWRQTVNFTKDDALPFPVITTAKGYKKADFLVALSRVEERARQVQYRGWSNNRWTGENNGSAEFSYDGWRWPKGYRTYLVAGVLPSREFYKFVTGKDLDTLTSYN